MNIKREQLQMILGEAFSVDPASITPASGSEDFDTWDSLNHLNAVVMLEEHCGVTFDIDEIASMQSIAEMIACLRGHGVEVDWPV